MRLPQSSASGWMPIRKLSAKSIRSTSLLGRFETANNNVLRALSRDGMSAPISITGIRCSSRLPRLSGSRRSPATAMTWRSTPPMARRCSKRSRDRLHLKCQPGFRLRSRAIGSMSTVCRCRRARRNHLREAVRCRPLQIRDDIAPKLQTQLDESRPRAGCHVC
jgi:hypothetical protein